MNISVENLILEVTRRCNMRCTHCLKGFAQNLNIKLQVIDNILDQVNYISSVIFTGGEPTLNTKAIQYFVDGLKKRGMKVGGFYVVTNGKIASTSLIHALIDLYSLADYDDTCALTMSQDEYHENVKIPTIYNALKFFHPEERKFINPESILDEGMAHYNGIGNPMKEVVVPNFEVEVDDDLGEDRLYIRDNLYIAANGNVITECNLSYKRIDKECLGNILTKSLVDIVGIKQKEVKVCA